MRAPFILLLLLASIASSAQDTLRVQTLTYDSITTRRGWWLFPDGSHTYRKVLMHHTLKCDPATTWDSYNCGQWDYLTYNFIHEHTGALDSNALQHPFFLVGTAAPDSADLRGVPEGDHQQRWQLSAGSSGVLNESVSRIGVGDAQEMVALEFGGGTVRSQYRFTASELGAAGLIPGDPIDQLRLIRPDLNGGIIRLIVRVAQTSTPPASAFEDDLITLYDSPTTLDNDTLTLTSITTFTWDGISDLLIDLAVENNVPLVGTPLAATEMGTPVGLQQTGRDGYMDLSNDFIGMDPAPLATLDDAVTITFRSFGAAILPQNTTMLEALDADGRRMLNIHLPWSDGRVYWDAGNDGSGYDRIDQLAPTVDIEGQWTDWAFVKNAGTGSMKIYKNGALWHSGTGKTRPLNGAVRMRIGADANGGLPWPGLLDEVLIFNTEVDAATIAAWTGRRIDATHPDYSSLIYGLHFDEDPTQHPAANAVDGAHPAWPMGTPRRDQYPAAALRSAPVPVTVRPDILFVQGDHVIDLDSTITYDNVPGEHLTIEEFTTAGNTAVPQDTLFGFLGRYYFTYAPDGTVVDSSYEGGTMHFNDTLDYFSVPFEVVNDREIGRYITPYGIGLDLGPQGFRWTFDVTDYQYLLHDSVELSAGNTQELIDLEFELIEGTPPREVVRHQRPWGGLNSFSYASLSDDSQLSPVTVDLDPAASQWSVRSRLTGHGHNSNDGEYPHCCEWKDNTHFLEVDGVPADEWHVWQTNDCALNPVYPQGGTWPGAREGWCPGDLVKDHVTEISSMVSGPTATLDYSITPVPLGNLGMGGGNYVVNMDLFEYGAPTHALDAEIYEVKRPTSADQHGRENPICMDPLVTLRNAGGTPLTSATITYSVGGGPMETHTWTGSLAHMQSEDVALPVGSGWFWGTEDQNIFTVTVSAPNGGADQYPDNDSYTTQFALPPVYEETFILYYKTNNRPFETSCVIRDLWGTVVYQQSWGALGANVTRYDTLELTPGCYSLELLDTGNDGIYYWADDDQGSGFFRFKHIGGGTFKNFEREFGRSIKHAFAIGDVVTVNEQATKAALQIVPNPGTGLFTLVTSGMQGPGTLEVFDAHGTQVSTRDVELHGNTRLDLHLEQLGDGLYMVRLQCEGFAIRTRLIKQ